jgi:hypothetical protein
MGNEWMDMEPEPAGALVPAAEQVMDVAPLASVLPAGFDIRGLLQFIPDVAIKRNIERLAAELRAIRVHGADGLVRAEAKRDELRAALAHKDQCFKHVCELANTLHKRFTGLRSDFGRDGEAADTEAITAIKVEKRRLDALAEAEARRLQQEADKEMRERLAQQAKDLKAAGAAPEVVREVKAAAKVAVAPPVMAPVLAPLSTSTLAKNVKARLRGTPDTDEVNPEIADMTPAQQAQVRAMCAKVATGEYPLAVLAGLDWGYLNARIKREGAAMGIAELEPYDVGSLRPNRGRR